MNLAHPFHSARQKKKNFLLHALRKITTVSYERGLQINRPEFTPFRLRIGIGSCYQLNTKTGFSRTRWCCTVEKRDE